MDNLNFKIFVGGFLFITYVCVVVLLLVASKNKEHYEDPMIVVVPTCAELDTYGYDGSISCINEDGKIVRPGED